VLQALGWSIAVIFVGGVAAAFTTPHPSGPTVVQQGFGLAVPAGEATTQPGEPTTTTNPILAGSPAVGSPSTASAPGTQAPTAQASAKTKAPTTSRPATTVARAGAAAAAEPRLQPGAGSYPLSISGTSSVDSKLSAVPAVGSLVIRQQGGDQQHSTVGVPGGLVLVQRASAGGVDLVSFSLTAGSKTLSFRPPAPVAFVRTTPGASWSWSVRSADGTVGLSQTANVTGTGSVTVGGTQVPAVTVQRVFTVSGAVQGTVQLTSSVSEVDRLPLVQHQLIDVKATVLFVTTRVVSDTTATLTSTSPR